MTARNTRIRSQRDIEAQAAVLKMVEEEALRVGMPAEKAAALAKECENDPFKAARILGAARGWP